MIRLNFSISNPWAKPGFRNFFCKEEKFTENKAYGIEITYHSPTILACNLELSWRGSDHSGPSIEFCFLSWGIHLYIYDVRHWNGEKNCWEVYD